MADQTTQTSLQKFLSVWPIMMSMMTILMGVIAGYVGAQLRFARYDWQDEASRADRVSIHTTLDKQADQIVTLKEGYVRIETLLKEILRRSGSTAVGRQPGGQE